MIRPATEADTPALLALSSDTGFFKPLEIEALAGVLNDYFASNRDDYGHRCFVWEDAGTVLGFVYHAPEEMTDRTWYLWWIAVAADRQGRGLGGKLLAFVENDVRELDGRLLVVETSDTAHYEPTRRFYLKRGFTAAANLTDFYADGDGMAVFTKRVDGATEDRGQRTEPQNHRSQG
ncbi:MAG: GNAT family N-acetyltransferase [Planctomycetes bacterium]|nr:GNAT family N-acetyltransferase [Planctomycetota bacterium]